MAPVANLGLFFRLTYASWHRLWRTEKKFNLFVKADMSDYLIKPEMPRSLQLDRADEKKVVSLLANHLCPFCVVCHLLARGSSVRSWHSQSKQAKNVLVINKELIEDRENRFWRNGREMCEKKNGTKRFASSLPRFESCYQPVAQLVVRPKKR